MTSEGTGARTIAEHELEQCERANQTGRQPVVFVHGPIDPAPFRGVLPLPISALRSASPVLGNPANRNRAVPLTFEHPARGPLLIGSGEKDHTVPPAVARASYQQQQGNPGVTETVEVKGRGHSLTIDSGWREVADTALAFVNRFT